VSTPSSLISVERTICEGLAMIDFRLIFSLVAPVVYAAVVAYASPVEANRRRQTAPGADTLIKGVLAPKVDDAVCFAGGFEGLAVNVWDYDKAVPEPVPGVFRFGEQATRPRPHVYANQELTRMTLLLYRDDREHESWDEMHDFRMRISLLGWPDQLGAAGECPLRLSDKPIEGSRDLIARNTTTLYCGIDCDGGGMEVERVAGTGEVNFRFNPRGGGLRMSGGCSHGAYHVGGDARPYDEELRKARTPVTFRLKPMPADACAEFRSATDRKDGGGQ
jgi:hypothetical protein